MFSDNLLYLRNIKGLSQEQVAEAVGISRQSYSKWEQGDTFPDIDKCDKLAKFYNITIDSLFKHHSVFDIINWFLLVFIHNNETISFTTFVLMSS